MKKVPYPMHEFDHWGPVLSTKAQAGLCRYVINHGRNNFDKIVLFRSGKEWMQATNNSALILKHALVDVLPTPKNMQETLDFASQQPRLFLSYKIGDKMEELRESVLKLGYEVLRNDDWIFAFAMKVEITSDEIAAWRREKEIRQANLDALLLPNFKSPTLSGAVRMIGTEVIWSAQGEAKNFGKEIGVNRLFDLYIRMFGLLCKTETNKKEMLVEMTELLNQTACVVSALSDSEMLDAKRSKAIAEAVNSLRKAMVMEGKKE
jgi:hypothetical protein